VECDVDVLGDLGFKKCIKVEELKMAQDDNVNITLPC